MWQRKKLWLGDLFIPSTSLGLCSRTRTKTQALRKQPLCGPRPFGTETVLGRLEQKRVNSSLSPLAQFNSARVPEPWLIRTGTLTLVLVLKPHEVKQVRNAIINYRLAGEADA